MSTLIWGFPNQQQVTDQQVGGLYQYKEVIITSAELINPGVIPVGSGTGKELLPPCAANQYYEWEFNMEFLPGPTTYTSSGFLQIAPSYVTSIPINTSEVSSNDPLIFLVGSRMGINYDIYNIKTGDGLYLQITPGDWTDGDGTFKVKIWYKLVQFG
jgi:hypothetical protein